MKKLARIIVIATVILALCLSLSACGTKYKSKYSSSTMVSSNTSDKASVSFDSFSGTYVIKLKNTGNDKVIVTFNATLKEGNVKVYYDFNDEKLNLFNIGNDGLVEGESDAFTTDKTIYIIIESDGKCKEGKFSFALEKARQ